MQNIPIHPQRVALITGGARRIGAEIANLLHASGINIIVHYHQSGKEAERLCQLLNEKRANSAALLQADLTATEILEGLIQKAVNVWGRLDILVNNAARFYKTPMQNTTITAWNDLLDSNLKAPFFLSQAAAPYLAQQTGCIINVADIHGERPMRDYSVYCISKAGIIMLTQCLAKELSPSVRVNAISPGQIIWPEGENQLTPDTKNTLVERIALKRIGSACEIAKAALFLVDNADYITGHVLVVDGGRSLRM
jgi:pteridine reductase